MSFERILWTFEDIPLASAAALSQTNIQDRQSLCSGQEEEMSKQELRVYQVLAMNEPLTT